MRTKQIVTLYLCILLAALMAGWTWDDRIVQVFAG
jgi:hypothetical protein